MTNNQEEDKKVSFIVSKVLDDGTILESVMRGKATELCVFKNGEWHIAPEHKTLSDDTYKPIPASNNLLAHRAILLPSSPESYDSNDTLVQDIKSYLARYVKLSPDAYEVATSYILLSWLHDALEELPYLRFLGDLGTGKTRSLKIIGSITNKPFFASAASTISPIFYALDQFRPTLVLDEADMRFSDAASEFAKVFNNGTSKGMPVLRQSVSNKNLNFEPRAFHVFGPKIVAMRKRFQDDGLESRFLTEEMRDQSTHEDIPINLPKAQADEALTLRNKLLLFRVQNLHKLKAENQEHLIALDRSGRFNQMLLPLLLVTDNQERREAIQRFAKRCDDRLQALRSQSLESIVVATYKELSAITTNDKIPIHQIADKVREEIEHPERPITNRLIGSILRQQLDLESWKSGGVRWVGSGKY
jgi:hypothetical protein